MPQKRIYLYVPFKDKEKEYFNYYKYTKKGLKMKNTIKLALLSIVTACVFSACSSEPKKYVIL
ncbi:TPA: hypothetical protein ACW37W_001861 [Campylobacter coli]